MTTVYTSKLEIVSVVMTPSDTTVMNGIGKKRNNDSNLTKKSRKKNNKFGLIKRNYLQRKLEKFIIDNGNKELINILSPEDFANKFVEEIKLLNENEELVTQIEFYLQALIRNTVRKSIRLNKIQNTKKKKSKEKTKIDDRESHRIKDILKARDILVDNSTYGMDDIGLKLTNTEVSSLPSNILVDEEFEIQIRKYNDEWRKFCTKISKII